ncbi:MAG: flagellar biosynthesis protein FliP [Rubrivivax sp.]|nr:MAG: flagellar biosynthesis protein FliP [Rubrivivax sp.]
MTPIAVRSTSSRPGASRTLWRVALLACLGLTVVTGVGAAELSDALPPIKSGELLGPAGNSQLTPYLRTLIGLSMLSLLPAALMAMTSFTRIVITLSFIRHALGLPETPPNAVLITISLFLTLFTMGPTLDQVQTQAFTPFMDGKLDLRQASKAGTQPFKDFMAKHVRESDLDLIASLARKPLPDKAESTDLYLLVPAFMLSELRVAFSVGFVIFLPFLLIDLIVSAVLMSLGMMMMPPATVSLPLKLLLFVLIDGWALIIRAIAGSYQ